MTTPSLPPELLGSPDDPAPPADAPCPPSLPKCSRCGSTELDEDDGYCRSCASKALEERIRAAQESRMPEEWATLFDRCGEQRSPPPSGAIVDILSIVPPRVYEDFKRALDDRLNNIQGKTT